MASCHICLDELKKPVALPCGHIFCGGCIVKTVQSVQPYSHLHACPLCRTLYNIAPINMQVVPPNLRPFVTPSIRRVYLNTPDRPASDQTGASCSSSGSTSSESSSTVSRLEAENKALRMSCAMWRRRAELHGSANLGLLNFAKMVRDQATRLVREREELEQHCDSLKHKLDSYESNQHSVDQLLQAFREAGVHSALDSGSSCPPQERCIKLLPLRARSGPQTFDTPPPFPPSVSRTASSESASSHNGQQPCRKRPKIDHDYPPSGSPMHSLVGTAGRAIFLPQTDRERPSQAEAL